MGAGPPDALTEEHRQKVSEMTAVAKFVLEAAGGSIIDMPQEKEPSLVSLIAKVRAVPPGIFGIRSFSWLFDHAVWWFPVAEGEGPDLQGRPRSQVAV